MDAATLRAMAKWPNVPAVFGWLSLDARGVWRIRGQAITHSRSREVIAANYGVDACGCWYFQNGPQRVFVELDPTPWVFHCQGSVWYDHTEQPVEALQGVWLDEDGQMYWQTVEKFGIVDDRDLLHAIHLLRNCDGSSIDPEHFDWPAIDSSAKALSALKYAWQGRLLPVQFVLRRDLADSFGFVQSPSPDICGNSG